MSREGGSLHCQNGHAFDIARQGYVSLLAAGTRPNMGDTADMVRARAGFLSAGHFSPIADALAAAATSTLAASSAEGCVLDVGAGTGYYLAKVLDRLPGRVGLALDMSKPALRAAAQAHDRAGAVGCDVWRRLPVADDAAVLALNVFAPRNAAEFRRVLAGSAARLLVVAPNRDHLAELVGVLGLLSVDEHKDERLEKALRPHFDLLERRAIRKTLLLRHPDVAAAVAMGPSAWHADSAAVANLIGNLPDPAPVTLSVTLSVLRPAGN
jgi:23S rRNA (guanine745-N1)-methyltransferase